MRQKVKKLRRQAELKRKLAGLDHEKDEVQSKLNANERERKTVREQLEKM